MRRFKCIVSYDGSNYIGWQSQCRNNSIQEKIEAVLKRISKQDIKAVAAGRTDAKVHAYGQVFHFDTDFYLDAARWHWAINGYLPDDIRVKSIEEVKDGFHARFSVKSKQYDYVINLGEYDVCKVNYAYQCRHHLDVDQMEEASRIFVGKHDFSSFCANSLEQWPNQIREISSITFYRDGDILTISYKGKGFLRYMVRMLTATLIEVGRGRLTPADVVEMLEVKDKDVCKHNAEPQGLYLIKIEYEENAKSAQTIEEND
ncbi:tRNA pseudouridine(38-40) synthase TruA [Anaerorhabdus sp.]|uniref:tRNA pseudouridine(38-40) synthase TruA n=1 Tax=Anaerorhabdus sp. TaxID=1872524 RepID=UPI002FC87E75